MNKIERRGFLALVLALSAQEGGVSVSWASEGDSGGEGDGGGGNSGSGGGEGGGGSDSDGDSGGGEGGGGDDGDDGDDSGGEGGRGRGRGRSRDQDRARKAVRSGQAISYKEAVRRVKSKYDGRVIDAKIVDNGKRLVYEFRLVSKTGTVRKVRMDAQTGRFSGLFGF